MRVCVRVCGTYMLYVTSTKNRYKIIPREKYHKTHTHPKKKTQTNQEKKKKSNGYDNNNESYDDDVVGFNASVCTEA